MSDYPTALELKAMKASDPDAYRRALDAIAERRGVEPDARVRVETSGARTGLNELVEHLRKAYGLTDGQTSQLGYIRMGAVYACVTLRADMLASLPIRAYRLGKTKSGKRIDITDPLKRRGMPQVVRGVRLAEASEVTEVEGTDISRRLAQPNEDWTGRMLIRMTETGLGLTGQAHWQLHGRGANATKPPQGMSWVRHDRVTIVKAGKNDQARTINGWMLDENTTEQQPLQRGELVWYRYPDPEDPDFGVLPPTDIARLGADSYQDAMTSNRDIFRRGLQVAGVVMPPEPKDFQSIETLTDTQVAEISRDIDRRWHDKNYRHRLAVLKDRYQIQSIDTVSPREAEFVALMEFAIEDAARVYRVPIEFIGGVRRTYQNMESAFKGIWMMALEPQATWLADEMTMRLLPAFGDEADFLAFDLSDVVALQEDEAERWRRQREQIETGVLLGNEWRAAEGMEEIETVGASIEVGKVTAIITGLQAAGQGQIPPESLKALMTGAMGLSEAAAEAIVAPIEDMPEPKPPPSPFPPQAPPAPEGEPVEEPLPEEGPTATEARTLRVVPPYGSDEHRAIMQRIDETRAPLEDALAEAAIKMLDEMRRSVVQRLRAGRSHGQRAGTEADLRDAFQRPRWVRELRERMRVELDPVIAAGGNAVNEALPGSFTWDPASPAAINAMRGQAQRFAESVTSTMWDKTKGSLAEGMEAGEGLGDLADRVDSTMHDHIRSSAHTIARTEVLSAYAAGSQIAAAETGLDLEKTWYSALDDRVRPDHMDAHGQAVPLDEPFRRGRGRGDVPGGLR